MTENIPSDSILVRNARLAVKRELDKKQALGLPIARFDPKTGAVWLEDAGGGRTSVEGGAEWEDCRG